MVDGQVASRRFSLDDLYRMTTYIYSEQNAQRPVTATFSHFVEVCGMLTVHDRRKKREGFTIEGALCKALGWYFPLLAKFKVKSIEEIVFRKYPRVCPYCRLEKHDDIKCKTIIGTERTVNHVALRHAYSNYSSKRPISLDDWQEMFQEIYPRTMNDSTSRNILGLMEEVGELGEAIRVFDRYPKYFAGEAADVFSYIMGFANEHMLSEKVHGREFSFEEEFLKRYPGMCVQCGYQVCICPLVPESTVGRLAKELDLEEASDLFALDEGKLRSEGQQLAALAVERVGGYPGLIDRFPFDRGDANRQLVLFCFRTADAIEHTNLEAAKSLRSAAIKIGLGATYAGSKTDAANVMTSVQEVERLLGTVDSSIASGILHGDASLLPLGKFVRHRAKY